MLTQDSRHIIDTIQKHSSSIPAILANSFMNQKGQLTIRLVTANPKHTTLRGLFSSWPLYQKGVVTDAQKNIDYITTFFSIEALSHYLTTGEELQEVSIAPTSIVLNAKPDSEELNRLLSLQIAIEDIKACSYQMPRKYGTVVRLYNSRPDKAEVPAIFKTKRDVDQYFSHLKIKMEYVSGTSYRTGNRKIEFSYSGDIDLLQVVA